MEDLRDEMEGLATHFGGDYDGWEASSDSLEADNSECTKQLN